MYKVIGGDQKEYGPVSADQIRQWVAEKRVNAQTRLQAAGSADWKLLSEFPEFAEALKNRVPAPPPAGAAPPPSLGVSALPPKTCGLAVWSLVLGILGLLCGFLAAIPGLILGIIALNRIGKSNGQLGGYGLALAGTIMSAVFGLLFGTAVMAAMLLPALAQAKAKAQSINCVNNLKQLAVGVRLYASDNKDQFPPAGTWCDALLQSFGTEKVSQCPAGDIGKRCHYAFNAKLSGMEQDRIDPNTVVLFETEGGWNLSGGPELMLQKPRHARRYVVVLADGSVQQMTEARLKDLRWDP
jgi:hypothetical protein